MREDSTLTNDVQTGDLQVPVNAKDHVQGPATAPLTLVEYADYECPYSRRAYHVIKGLQRELGDQLRFVYRNFPLREIHPHAEHAAEAAEAAANQGKFWEMHDFLFEHQRRLRDQDLRAYSEALGLDVERFDHELAEHLHAARIHEDFVSGVRSRVNGTPTFYINGARYDDSYELQTLLAALERAAASERGTR